MNWSVIGLLYRHELRMLVRGRRTVITALVLPALLMPIMLYSSKFTRMQREKNQNETVYRYTITGSQADRIRAVLSNAVREVALETDEQTQSLRQFKSMEVPVSDPLLSLESRNIHLVIETFSGNEADAMAAEDSDDKPVSRSRLNRPLEKRLSGVPLVRIIYRGNNDASDTGSLLMESLLRYGRRKEAGALLVERGYSGRPDTLFAVASDSIATNAQVTNSTVGRFVTAFLVMLLLAGGSMAAMDIIAGEKERGTIETLLTTAAGRPEIVTAKQLAICTVGIVITLIQVLNFFIYVKLSLVQLPQNFALEIPSGTVLILLALFVPLAATIGAILLMISAYARSYKEAQMYFFPVYLLSLFPALAAVLPGLPLRSAIVFVPLANVSVAVRELLVDRADMPMVGVSFIVMTMTATMLMRASAGLLARENIIVPAHSEPEELLGGPPLFQKRVIRWFVVMWAVVFGASANVPQLATFRAQLFFNEFVVFIGASLLMILIYRLNVREVLSLKPVRWPVWIAVVLAAPAGNLLGVATFRLLSHIFPMSEQMADQMAALTPVDIPTWQLYIFLGLIPGVCEELAFRGVLLNGLKRKVKPVFLPFAVGIIFGLFHFTLFRIGPTAFLGILLTLIAMWTGSVLPGIVFHALNNSFAVWASDNAWNIGSLETSHYIGAGIIFLLAMWIVYRNRASLQIKGPALKSSGL